MKHLLTITTLEHVTHDVLRIVTTKPAGLTFDPGQAADISINLPEWEEALRPFTFTSLPHDPFLEFTIKVYPEQQGVTQQLAQLQPGNELLIHGVFGAIFYRGKGAFIAGGAGITPFLSILRQLHTTGELAGNLLIFANKTQADIIQEQELTELLDNRFIPVLSEEKTFPYAHGYITETFLREHLQGDEKYFYLCGPPPMMESVEKHLRALGVPPEAIVQEAF